MVVYFSLARRPPVVDLKLSVVKVDDVTNEVVVGGNDEVK